MYNDIYHIWLGCSAGELSKAGPGLHVLPSHCMYFLSHSGSLVLHKEHRLVGPVFCALPRPKQPR